MQNQSIYLCCVIIKPQIKKTFMKLKNVFPIVATVFVGLIVGCSSDLDSNNQPAGTLINPLKSNLIINATPAISPTIVNLKTAARFGILSGVAITSTGYSTISDLDVGIYPGLRNSVVGFPPAVIQNGSIYTSDDTAISGTYALLRQAKQDLADAYLFAEAAISPIPVIMAGDQGGNVLTPGIYKSVSSLLIQNGDLILDAQGDSTAVWIFQVGSALTTVGGVGGNVLLRGGAQAKNIFWQISSSATLGANTSFKGNLLALTSITLNSGASITGRLLSRNAGVTLTDTNIISKP